MNEQQQSQPSNNNLQLPKNSSSNSLTQSELQQQQQNQLGYDEHSKAFLDAKKKLRIVLSWSDNCTYNFMPIMQFK